MKFTFDCGFGYPHYLAHLTLGVGSRTLWLSINTRNWKVIHTGRNWLGDLQGCLSVFTFTITKSFGFRTPNRKDKRC